MPVTDQPENEARSEGRSGNDAAGIGGLHLLPLPGVPLIAAGDDLVALTLAALSRAGVTPCAGDVLVYAQKIVSKAEGRSVDLRDVKPSPRACELAARADKDPRLVELILSESADVIRVRPGVIIVEHRSGLILANAGIDRSNVGDDRVLLLPRDADASACGLREGLAARGGLDVGVLIIDSIGRAWRNGTIGTAIGASGLTTLLDLRGHPDLFGRALETTEVGRGDEIASAASLVMGQAAESYPIVLVSGLAPAPRTGSAHDLLRSKAKDLFR
ncbi:MAG: coenzyme F420-0:L-glutamate ligase [Alphaproteobacteria bacterium]|nr:coenzyme F420-0:L-glutamate ligase [Alphaproteobacteria bacterium]